VTPGLVIFDCDGVLVDSEPIANRVFAEVVTEEGLPTTYADSVANYLGRSFTECAADVVRELGRPLRTDLLGEYERRCAQRLRVELKPVPGVVDLLDALVAAGVPRCVASSGTPSLVTLKLSVTGLDAYFGERVFTAAMVERGKPAPDLFQFAARACGVDPADCVVIEDSPAGVRAARAAGATVVALVGLIPADRLAAAGADTIVTDLAAVAPLLGLA
jgi:HAD superfamily hydrolase (TIGR01509 family)